MTFEFSTIVLSTIKGSKIVNHALLILLIFLTAVATAETPDGETPANEGVCDKLLSSTPGLYGLCVAYCEAQDLDEFGEQKVANDKLLDVYNKKRRAGDPEMPCRRKPCPCWNADEFDYLSNNIILTMGSCKNSDTPTKKIAQLFGKPGNLYANGVFYTDGRFAKGLCQIFGFVINEDGKPHYVSRKFSFKDESQFYSCYYDIASVCP